MGYSPWGDEESDRTERLTLYYQDSVQCLQLLTPDFKKMPNSGSTQSSGRARLDLCSSSSK